MGPACVPWWSGTLISLGHQRKEIDHRLKAKKLFPKFTTQLKLLLVHGEEDTEFFFWVDFQFSQDHVSDTVQSLIHVHQSLLQ